jgi:hypothetical protein
MSGATLAIILLLATLLVAVVVGLLEAHRAYREALRTRKSHSDGPASPTHA